MRCISISLLLLLLLPLSLHADDEPPSAAPAAKAPAKRTAVSLDAVRKHCEWLTSVERMGRLKWEHREAAAAYIAKAFEAAGLKPLPGKTDYNDDHESDTRFGKMRNVVGWLPGTKAGTTKEKPGDYVILSAHYATASPYTAGIIISLDTCKIGSHPGRISPAASVSVRILHRECPGTHKGHFIQAFTLSPRSTNAYLINLHWRLLHLDAKDNLLGCAYKHI